MTFNQGNGQSMTEERKRWRICGLVEKHAFDFDCHWTACKTICQKFYHWQSEKAIESEFKRKEWKNSSLNELSSNKMTRNYWRSSSNFMLFLNLIRFWFFLRKISMQFLSKYVNVGENWLTLGDNFIHFDLITNKNVVLFDFWHSLLELEKWNSFKWFEIISSTVFSYIESNPFSLSFFSCVSSILSYPKKFFDFIWLLFFFIPWSIW